MATKLQISSISFCNKAVRLIWQLTWVFLFRPSPRPFHSWRKFLLSIFGAKIGKNVRIYSSARIWAPWNLTMKDYSCLGDFVDCYSVDKILIGEHATVSQYCFLCTASHDYSIRALPLITAPIKIGSYAWVTADVFVAPGVSIGDGAVINARSSVFNDIPDWMIARGNPAMPYKKRILK